MSAPYYRCWAEIDRSALRHNARVLRHRVGAAVEVLAVVKANAYGHGLIDVARTLAGDVQLFGVANLEEATLLRAAVPHPIVLLGPTLPEERKAVAGAGFIPAISSLEEARDFNAQVRGSPLPLNLKIDTGMGRMGLLPGMAAEVLAEIAHLPHVTFHSLSTHLPVSNEDEGFTRAQLRDFRQLVTRLRRDLPDGFKVHALQSVGVMAFGSELFDIVRPGILLYGISPLPQFAAELRPVLSWKTRIALIRDMPAGHGISYGRTFITPGPMKVATLSAGYADGYPRHLSNRGAEVLVRGVRCPLLGRVTMDLMSIDVSHLPVAAAGDEVVLLGRQGGEEISAGELAEKAGTISWEITTRIGHRVRRVQVN